MRKKRAVGSALPTLWDTLMRVDMFGEPVGFTVEHGRHTTPTFCGSLMTVTILVCLCVFGLEKYSQLSQFEMTRFKSKLDLGSNRIT